ncbi:MAG TPA: ABC-three component system protein, partial [Candidatus Nitrosotalea sp.]|nr:ABC-three component system protein [Candidatus Nitrosotalea sp.]
MSTHSAQASFLGYEYQTLQALLLISPSGQTDAAVYLEIFDDVTFENGDYKEVMQTKFSLNDETKITSKDQSFWKTIRNWMDIIEMGLVSTEEYVFTIITTRKTDDEIILLFTENPNTRDNKKILELLTDVAKTIDNTRINSTIERFLKLGPIKQRKIVDKIRILTNQPDIEQIQKEIERHLIGYTLPAFKDSFFDAIYGWWYRQVIHRLSHDVSEPLTQQSLIEVMGRQRSLQAADVLPIHFDNAELTENIFDAYATSKFVEQLKIIDLEDSSILKSILHYYKASEQRSRWFRVLNDTASLLDKYDSELKEKYDSQFSHTERESRQAGISNDDDLIPYGIKNFEWMDNSNYYPDLKLENSLSKIWLWK